MKKKNEQEKKNFIGNLKKLGSVFFCTVKLFFQITKIRVGQLKASKQLFSLNVVSLSFYFIFILLGTSKFIAVFHEFLLF